MKQLAKSEVMALGFMTFALFLGAGNIIFPAAAGLHSGQLLWQVALGFLLTGVGLPLLTVVALARVGGGLQTLTAPLGRLAGTLFAVTVYLAIGPMFATPRTAVVSYEMGIAPFTGNNAWSLALYSVLYFALVIYLALNPGKILQRIGQIITPVLLLALVLLGAAALFRPAGEPGQAVGLYASRPLTQGFLDGYLTMDALGALVFGVVIAASIRNRGVLELKTITRHSIQAGVIAAVCLSLVYVSLFYLGAGSRELVPEAQNGGQVLTAYVEFAFGQAGLLLLAVVIGLACLTTATGLLVACGEYFQQLWSIRYKYTVVFFALFSLVFANQGLTRLISVSAPVLISLYPLAIVLVALGLLREFWHRPPPVFKSAMATALVFGVLDGLASIGHEPAFTQQIPLADKQLGWVLPVLAVVCLMTLRDRWCAARQRPDAA